MSHCKNIRALFILVQISLTIYFIWYSVDNWEQTPTVTSIEFTKLQNEEFPAVSICFENEDWKWPALINLATKWKASKPNLNLNHLQWKKNITDHMEALGEGKGAFLTNKYLNYTDFTLDMCSILKNLFPSEEDKEVREFLLALSSKIENELNGFGALQLWHTVVKTTDFQAFRTAACSLGFVNCNKLNTGCWPPMKKDLKLTMMFLKEFCKQWAYRKFFNARTLLQIQAHQAFKANNDVVSQYDKSYLMIALHKISSLTEADVISMWYYLNGKYLKNKGIGKILIDGNSSRWTCPSRPARQRGA